MNMMKTLVVALALACLAAPLCSAGAKTDKTLVAWAAITNHAQRGGSIR